MTSYSGYMGRVVRPDLSTGTPSSNRFNTILHPLTGSRLPMLGTAGLVSSMRMRGIQATRNFSDGPFENFEQVSGEALAEDWG